MSIPMSVFCPQDIQKKRNFFFLRPFHKMEWMNEIIVTRHKMERLYAHRNPEWTHKEWMFSSFFFLGWGKETQNWIYYTLNQLSCVYKKHHRFTFLCESIYYKCKTFEKHIIRQNHQNEKLNGLTAKNNIYTHTHAQQQNSYEKSSR